MTAPASKTTISAIQTLTGWKEQTGSNIGGVAPAKYSFSQNIQWQPQAALLAVTGISGKYCDWLVGALALPLLPNTGHLALRHRFMVDAGFAQAAQARELDTKITDANGITYNGSSQWNCAEKPGSMSFQVDKAGGGWVDTGIVIPKFAPNVEHVERIEYEFNIAAKTYSVVSIEVDGVLYPLPANLQNLPGKNVGWAKSEILPQMQQDVNTTGGSWEWLVEDLSYEIW